MPQLVALMDDLMFLSRIREAARGTAVEVKSVRGTAQLLAAAREDARLVVVDAETPRVPWREALAALRADPGGRQIEVIAFLGHERADLGRGRAGERRQPGDGPRRVRPRAAQARGCDAETRPGAAGTVNGREHS
jgi:CheY-like chemotaxis protein